MRVLYLHGFASSARSSKATFFAQRLASHGVTLDCPDLNEPDFCTLTVTRMLNQVSGAIDAAAGPVVLVGSSLGAFVAVLSAVRRRDRVEKLVLLAPALDFGGNRMRDLGDRGIDEWRETDRLNVFHYGYGRVLPVHFELYADARRYDAFNAPVDQPVLAFQGTRDTAVDPDTVRRWADGRPNVELHLLDDDHQLLASLEFIWRETSRFLGLGAP